MSKINFDGMTGSQAFVCVLIIVAFCCGLVWVEGWLAVTAINYLAQSQKLPATHSGYIFAGVLISILQGIFKRSTAST